MRFIILAFIVLIFAGLAQAQDATTTNFCADAIDCCSLVVTCLASINQEGTDAFPGVPACPQPTCPLGFALSSTNNACSRIDTKLDATDIPPFSSLSECLAATPFPQSYHTRHCIEGLNQAKRACLFNLGLKG